MKRDSTEYIGTYDPNTRLKFESKICKIKRGSAVLLPFLSLLVFSIDSFFSLYLLMDVELGIATYLDRLLETQTLSTPTFSLIGNDEFYSCHVNLVSKSGKKSEILVLLGFRGYLGEIESVFIKYEKSVYTFFLRLQKYVRIRSFNFRILTRKIDGA